MADVTKAQKLAFARKKLKEYQQTQSNKRSSVKKGNEELLENVTPADSMTSSTHSAFDSCPTVQEEEQHIELDVTNNHQQQQQFIDNNNAHINTNYFFNNSLFGNESKTQNTLSNYFDTIPSDTDIQNKTDAFLRTPANNTNECELYYENQNQNQNSEYPDPFSNVDISTLNLRDVENTEIVERGESESALDNHSNPVFSNTESLRQLSSQLNSLLDTEQSLNNTEMSGLEKRNQELSLLLETERLKVEQFSLQTREYQMRINQLETECQQIRTEHETKLSLEIGPLQEQLQYHVQTVGILVGEKTELSVALNQSQAVTKQKTSECEELQSRLKASRHRVADLEKEINHVKSMKDNQDKQQHESEKLKQEFKILKEQLNELTEENSELKEKLNTKIQEYLTSQQEIQEKNSQLSFAQLRIQQLSTNETMLTESQVELLYQQKIALEQQLTELTETVKVANTERDQANQQYQQYVQQLNGQIQSLAEKLEMRCKENETLSERERSLVKHIGELEKVLQQLQNEQRQQTAPINALNESKKLEEDFEKLQMEKVQFESQYQEELEKRKSLDTQVVELKNVISGLENKFEQFEDQPDTTKLLATMESDKVAASRAVEQNKKLKEQLEELNDAFIKLSNNKLELTEQLHSAQYQSQEFSEQIENSNSTLTHLHDVIAVKDNEYLKLQNTCVELEKQILQQNQLTDRLRHYEMQGNNFEHLQHELQDAKFTIEKLTNENKQLYLQIKNELNKNVDLQQPLEENVIIINNGDESKSEHYLNKEKAMEQLEERFKKTMLDVANLTEEKHRLEHLVLQLQGETETIGEYVTLYQCQRALLKEKTIEKDEQLKRLAYDREEMRQKLEQLNGLVAKLMEKKGFDSQRELLLHHASHQHQHYHPSPVGNESHDNNNKKEDDNDDSTAEKIIELLSEIKTSNLVQSSGDGIQNFHPCALCSGKLLTV